MNTTASNDIPDSPPPAPERIVWQGTPSQLLNVPQYLLWAFVFLVLVGAAIAVLGSMDAVPGLAIAGVCVLAAIPLLIIGWKWLVLANTEYELTTQRLRTRHGVLNKHLDELELYRVRDYKLEQPFFLRMFSLSTVILTTSDRSNPILIVRAIPRGNELREEMRTYVEEARLRRGVREVDMT